MNKTILEIIDHLNWMLQYHIKKGNERKVFIKCIEILCEKVEPYDDKTI